ncbi:MAG: DUF4365 domain-containing protein [Bacteroidia bacterium]
MPQGIRDTRPQNATGMSEADIIVQGKSGHGWQPFSAINDNGVDALIIYRKNGVDTGEIMFAQVKCGTGNGYFKTTKKRPSQFGIHLGEDYINIHRPRWDKLPGPIILIYVDFHTRKSWWTDLRNDLSYTNENKSLILIPKSQRFGKHSFGEFKNLKGRIFVSKDIPEIEMCDNELEYLKFNKSIKDSAAKFYKHWSNSAANERNHPELGEIIVSRVGWRHITRLDRKQNRIINSLSLLSVAKRIILSTSKCYTVKNDEIKRIDGEIYCTDYLALRCNVKFTFRQKALIQVILKRKRKLDSENNLITSKIWFYSVYEPLSKK